METLDRLEAGMPIVFGGNRVTRVSAELADAFTAGDALIVLQDSGEILHVPAAEQAAARSAVDSAVEAFDLMGAVTDGQITQFYERFADALEDEASFAPIATANAEDVDRAKARGRSTTRLVLSDSMRADMVAGLRAWAATPAGRGQVIDRIDHGRWAVEQVRDRLGVVGFVFEGRPNVFADATGVLRSGNTVVFRIGSDALGTARAIVEHALRPALAAAGLPDGAASLVDSAAHAAGWAMFADPRLALAVARGSGAAVRQLGSVARQAGNNVSLHGTGGGWMVAASSTDAGSLRGAVIGSLDRKVCNTLNVLCVPSSRAEELVPVFCDALTASAAERGTDPKLWVEEASTWAVDPTWFARTHKIHRADGVHDEPAAQTLPRDELGREWEWEDSPEVTLVVVESVDEAVELFNRHAPGFVVSLLSTDADERERFFAMVDSPYVGNGFTRWVDGQYALGKPELGLSNWEGGRLFGRSGILSGDSVFTVRLRATQSDPELRR